MKVIVDGIGEKNLTAGMFVASGGEGSIYVSGKTAYKVFEPADRAIPVAKFTELQALTDARIIRPERMLLDKKHAPVGFTMKAVKAPYTLCHLFPRTFLSDHAVTMGKVHGLVTQLYEITDHAHQKHCLIVDLNELNFLTDRKIQDVFAIDVNSWQTPSFRATAIMDSIRDRHVVGHAWSEESDWFSWAVVTFQLWTGQHPYKGGHPDYKGKLVARVEQRMQDNVSVFNGKATVPGACGSFEVIPKSLRDYYAAVFEDGVRETPPFPFDAPLAKPVVTTATVVNGAIKKTRIKDYDHDVVRVYRDGPVVLADNTVNIRGRIFNLPDDHKAMYCQPETGQWVSVSVGDGIITSFVESGEVRSTTVSTSRHVVESSGHVYAVVSGGMMKLEASGMRQIANILPVPEAVSIFDGAVMQNLLGRWHVAWLPRPAGCHMTPLPELDGVTPVSGRMVANVLVVAGEQAGQYNRYEFRFDADGTYDGKVFHDVDSPVVNFTVIDSGVVVLIDASDKLHLFQARKGGNSRSIRIGTGLDGGYRLWTDGINVLASRGASLYRVSMT